MTKQKPAVAVVLCTYNGALYLAAQLDSILAQTYSNTLLIFDDGSSDDTVRIVREYQADLTSLSKSCCTINLVTNPINLGYVKNFEQGIKQALALGFDYIALSDQDDVWAPERLAAGVAQLQQAEASKGVLHPCLVHSDLCVMSATMQMQHPSFLQYRGYGISAEKNVVNIVGQNGVMGNTILMNRALAHMVLPMPQGLHVHDYWLAVLAELFGTRIFIHKSLVYYRIHSENSSNSSAHFKSGLRGLLQYVSFLGVLKRDFRLPFKEDSRIKAIEHLLHHSSDYPALTEDQLRILLLFQRYLSSTEHSFSVLCKMLRLGFFKPQVLHLVRVFFSYLTTRRYQ